MDKDELLKACHERAVIKKGARWLSELARQNAVPVDDGPCREPPDGWIHFGDARKWVEVVSVTADNTEAERLWAPARGKPAPLSYGTFEPDAKLADRFREAVIKKLTKEGYKQLAQQFERGLLFVHVDSPLALGDSSWRSLTDALDALIREQSCGAFEAVLVMTRIDDRAELRNLHDLHEAMTPPLDGGGA